MSTDVHRNTRAGNGFGIAHQAVEMEELAVVADATRVVSP
ncbi:luciferase family domain protein [Mycobacterium xenopi 3993]|nr:luciferase family domain protein [Mycobacterium xenopi 3993]